MNEDTNDELLKQALAAMLPDHLEYSTFFNSKPSLIWAANKYLVRDTELLYLCKLAEEKVDKNAYVNALHDVAVDTDAQPQADFQWCCATWQQRVTALTRMQNYQHVATGTATVELPYLITTRTTEERCYNPKFGDDRVCKCGHPYYRHFDSYAEMEPCGCKYCSCCTFDEASTEQN